MRSRAWPSQMCQPRGHPVLLQVCQNVPHPDLVFSSPPDRTVPESSLPHLSHQPEVLGFRCTQRRCLRFPCEAPPHDRARPLKGGRLGWGLGSVCSTLRLTVSSGPAAASWLGPGWAQAGLRNVPAHTACGAVGREAWEPPSQSCIKSGGMWPGRRWLSLARLCLPRNSFGGDPSPPPPSAQPPALPHRLAEVVSAAAG